MQVQLYSHLKDSSARSLRFPSFKAFADFLQAHPHVGDKEAAPLWAPQEFHVGAPQVRAVENVGRLHAVVIDVDDFSALDWTRIVETSLVGREAIVHTSYSHWRAVGQGLVRLRVVLSVSRSVEASEWPEVRERVRRILGITKVDKKRGVGGMDQVASSAATAFFVWSWPAGAEGVTRLEYRPGAVLDVDALLRQDKRAQGRARPTVAALRAEASKMARSRKEERRDLGQALGLLASGEPFAQEGERDSTAFLLAGILARGFPGATEAEICAVFRQSIDAMAGQAGALTHEQIADKVARQCAQRVETDTGDPCRERWRECLARSGREEVYSEEELEDLADQVGVPRSGLSSAWVLQSGPGYYLLSSSGYLGPYQASEVSERAEVVLAPADSDGVRVQELRAGRVQRVKSADLVASCGRVLDGVVYSLSRSHSGLVERDGRTTLYLASCPLRPLQAERDEQIERWLALLGDRAAEYLLDWLATCVRLERPAQALFLEGASGAGKSMLVEGLARLWTERGPTTLDDLMASHNDPVLECPLVFGDESIPLDRGLPRLDELKREISRARRYVNPKYVKKTPVEGAVRIVLAANNRRLLLSGADLTPDDVEALRERMIHVEVGRGAAEYLETLPSETIDCWVEGDGIARHVLWLAETRKVAQGNRFVMCAAPNEGLRSLATDTGLRAAICHWVTLWLTTVQPSTNGLIRCKDGRVWVSAKGLHSAWSDYDVSVPRPPTISRLADALRPLASERGYERVGGVTVTFEVLRTEVIADWAESKGFATLEDLVAKIAERAGTGA